MMNNIQRKTDREILFTSADGAARLSGAAANRTNSRTMALDIASSLGKYALTLGAPQAMIDATKAIAELGASGAAPIAQQATSPTRNIVVQLGRGALTLAPQ